MNINSKTTISEGDKPMNTNRQTTIKENKMKVTTPNLIRAAGLSAMAAGIIFIVIQPIHPAGRSCVCQHRTLQSSTTLKTVMCILGLYGVAGLYARQVEKTGWLGLAGYLLFSLFYDDRVPFSFIEPFILPLLATQAPKFVAGIMGMVSSVPSEVNLGALPALWMHFRFHVYLRTLAVWHRYLPRPHPVLAGRLPCWPSEPCRSSSVQWFRPEWQAGDHGAGGDRFCLAGIFALFRTASAGLGTRTWHGKPPAQPNRSR